MRASSRCFVHPSREAQLRCQGCGRWLCEGCARHWRDRVWCSWRCRVRWLGGAALARIRATLASPVHPAWAITVCSVGCAILISAIVVPAAKLLAETRRLAAVEAAARLPRPLSGRLTTTGGSCDLELTGMPHAAVMVLGDRLEPIVVELDERGRGRVRGLRLPADISSLRLLPVDLKEGSVIPLPTPTSAATPTSAPTPSPTPTAASTPTWTPSPVPSPSPTPSPSPSAPSPRAGPGTPAPSTPTGPAAHPSSGAPLPPVVRDRSRRPPARGAPPVLQLIADAGPRLALTFDGGQAASGTDELLDLLEELNLHVTLFVTGDFIDEHPALVRRAVLAGHEVGNHTYSHGHLTSYASDHRHHLLPGVTREWLQDELRRTEHAFVHATGRSMAPLWRAPYGEENAILRGWAMELGYLHVRWSSLGGKSLDSLDWVNDEHSAMYRDSERIVARLLGFPRLQGGIVLMHLSSERELPPWRELPTLLQRLRDRRLAVVTVSQLLAASPTWRGWLERAESRHAAVFGGDRPAAVAGSQP